MSQETEKPSTSKEVSISIKAELSPETTASLVGVLTRLVEPFADIADIASGNLKFLKLKSAIKIVERTKAILDESGIEPKELPAKFLGPFLEHCSLESENSDLIENWANLLASAAKNCQSKHRAFVSILSELGSEEARMLDELWKQANQTKYEKIRSIFEIFGSDLNTYWDGKGISLDSRNEGAFKIVTASSLPADAAIEDFAAEQIHHNGVEEIIDRLFLLERLRLIVIKAEYGPHKNEDMQVRVLSYAITPLGYEFVTACNGSSLK